LPANCKRASIMQTKDVQALEEKRAYYRVLRYLVSSELHEDQGQPLQNKDFPMGLAQHEPSIIH
jgi:hypothetical protein